jgi:hypothetical protein
LFYRELARRTEEYRKQSGHWRHAGALYANTAAACAAQKNLDDAVIELLKAAADDEVTYHVPKQDSFAIQSLLDDYFCRPGRDKTLELARTVNPALDPSDIERFCRDLGKRAYAFLAYVHIAERHERANREFPNDFSKLQLLSALQNLSCLLELDLKTVARLKKASLLEALCTLYEANAWWSSFDAARIRVGATRESSIPVDKRLTDTMTLSPADDDERFWQSLLVAYIVRNYTVHEWELPCALTECYSRPALGHVLHVMITARRHASVTLRP